MSSSNNPSLHTYLHDLFFFFQIFGLRPTRRGMPRVDWRAGRGRLTPTSFKSCQSDQPSPEKVEPQLANDKAAGESSGASYCLLYLLLARILSNSGVPLCLGCIHSFGRQLRGSLPPQLLPPLLSPTSQVWSLKHFLSFAYLFATDVLLWRCRGQ